MATQWAPVFLHHEVLFDLVVHSVGVSKYVHYTAQAEESVLNSGAPRTGGSVVWASGCHAEGREFDSGRTITHGL